MLVPVLSKIRPLKCWDFVSKRRFPVSFPRFTVVFPDFQRNNTQGGDYQNCELSQKAMKAIMKPPQTKLPDIPEAEQTPLATPEE